MSHPDVLVVGAGAAGLTAAIFARRAGASVTLLESTPHPGQKILISGGGRCNVLPSRFSPERFVSESPRACTRILKGWRLEEVRGFFEAELGVALSLEEESGKLFPSSNRARDVLEALLREAASAGVEIVRTARVVDVTLSPLAVAVEGGPARRAERIVLATGGLSIPRTGSDGGGIEIARRLGHRVVEPYPALTPLRSASEAHRALAGVSLSVELFAGGPPRPLRASGGFLFTHGGYSGPAVLDVSHTVAREPGAPVSVAWTGVSREEWTERLARAPGSAVVENVVGRFVPARLAAVLLAELGVQRSVRISQFRRESRLALLDAMTRYRLPVSGHEGFARAEVTGGGVALEEVDAVTLESRRVPGLYLCGEILDAFGPIGGHNFLWAWVTGRSAGSGAGGSRRGR